MNSGEQCFLRIKRCKFCYYSDGNFCDDAVQYCHRYPRKIDGRYPKINETDWCGEFRIANYMVELDQVNIVISLKG